MRSALALALFAALARADEDPELRFLRAWYAMGEPDKAAAAEETFRALHDAAGTPEELKARCLLGLAECARIAGDEPKALDLLAKVVAEHPRTDAAGRARRMLGKVAYLDRVLVVPGGRYLDLDDGSVSATRRPVPGKEAEMRDGELLVEAADDAEFATKVAAGSSKPWRRIVTSEGRTSWLQVLEIRHERGTAPPAIVRLVTRLAGVGEVLPAPRGPFCIGRKEGIEVRFEPSRQFARYTIQRSVGGDEPVEIGAVPEPPFLDRTAEEGVRYLYRIAGEDAEGARGLPATIEGTRKSCGVVSGIAELNRMDAKCFDFLLGAVAEDGDITMTGAYGNWDGGSFIDAFGRGIRAVAPALGGPRPAWDEETQGSDQIPSGSVFVVPLRGGGVARCRLEMTRPEHSGGVEAILHYDACGDAAALPMPVRLEAKRGETGAVVAVAVDPPYRVDRLEVTDLTSGQPLAPIEVKGGVARDLSATEGQLREYRAVAVDPHGRKSAVATAALSLLPDGPRMGEFRFHYQQGFSIETGRIVPADQADVFFATCAGGLQSIDLTAPGGILNLERILPREIDPGTAQAVFDLLLRADPQVALGRQARGDSRTPAADVFLLRTRHGGWAKLAIVHRGNEGGWQEFLATVRYVFNAKEPVFGQGDGEAIQGITFADLQPLRARAQILEQWQRGWQQMMQDPVRRKALEGEAREEGVMPDPATTQEVLWSRQRHKDYEKATFNFIFGIRDDPGLAQTRNDWCLQYGNGGDTFDVCMVTDDRSTITDLGTDDWKGLARRKRLEERGASRAPARYGRLYLVHTLDTDENFFSLLRVTAIRPGDLVAFEWISLRGETLARSPGLVLDEPTEKALTALLATLPRTPEERGRDPAIRMRLGAPEIRIGVVAEDPATLLAQLGEITGVRFVVKAKDVQPVTVFGTRLTPEGILDAISEETGLRWRVEEDGSVSIGGE